MLYTPRDLSGLSHQFYKEQNKHFINLGIEMRLQHYNKLFVVVVNAK